MAVPPNLLFRLRFDEAGIHTLAPVRDLRLVSNQLINLEVQLEKLIPGSIPPGFTPVDITGWNARWIMKLDIDDADGAKKWDVAGSLVGPGTDGRFLFTVTKALANFVVEFGYSELTFRSGADPEIRQILPVSLSKPVLAT